MPASKKRKKRIEQSGRGSNAPPLNKGRDMDSALEEVMKPETGEEIDIILPTHGRLADLTIPCVSWLYAHTRSRFQLIVVDDTTPEMDEGPMKTVAWFKRLQIEHNNITFVHSDTPYRNGNQIFNIGLAHSKNRFVATVMNSVRVEPNWDIVPVQMMQRNDKIGIIGIKCLKLNWDPPENRQNGIIECAGVRLNGWIPEDMGRDEPGHRYSESYPVQSCQWAFALLRREAVVGNLSEELWQGFVGWDDLDNTLYLRYKGWEAWYCGIGCGYHQTHATRGSSEDEKLIKNRVNAETFYKRWGLWEMFRAKNPYAPTYFPDGQVQFLSKLEDIPLERQEAPCAKES